jgi:hypothetical protein
MKITENDSLTKIEEQESYVPLAKEIIKNGFLYTLVDRCEWKAIYAQCYKGAPGYPIAHEIFYVIKKFRKANPRSETKRWAEAFPADTDFGKIAWSITRDRAKALDRYNRMERREGDE